MASIASSKNRSMLVGFPNHWPVQMNGDMKSERTDLAEIWSVDGNNAENTADCKLKSLTSKPMSGSSFWSARIALTAAAQRVIRFFGIDHRHPPPKQGRRGASRTAVVMCPATVGRPAPRHSVTLQCQCYGARQAWRFSTAPCLFGERAAQGWVGKPVASGRLKVVEPDGDGDDWPCPPRLYNSNRASASCYGARQCKADQVGEDSRPT